MANDGSIRCQYTERTNEAAKFYWEDGLEECVALAQELLDDPDMPRYYRIKALVLLGATVDDVVEANDYSINAEALWRLEKRWHIEDEDENVDLVMAELGNELDELRSTLQEGIREKFNFDEEEDSISAHDDEVADTQAMS
ncbi:hypothetical protein BKA66DRAFT_529178 [Pyrenochaeta sp. MPI-SDFR-AT-0127]|nr:hypothetical protein BKA66DRAFT_529178 [Pyrenochaeta sp. MPI-SDFR-AT-0127]